MRATARAVNAARTDIDRWKALRAFYKEVMPQIMAGHPWEWAIDPYEVDWLPLFTPIEYGFWQDIRGMGAVLYPQFPIGRYFADFANPLAHVVIECDGAAYHKDKQKDTERERAINDHGYRVYRLNTQECFDTGTLTKGEALIRSMGLARYPCEAE